MPLLIASFYLQTSANNHNHILCGIFEYTFLTRKYISGWFVAYILISFNFYQVLFIKIINFVLFVYMHQEKPA